MSDLPSEDDLHRWASDTLEYALLFRTPMDVLACLKKLDRLDGHAFKILVGQLDGTIPPKTYRTRFELKQKPGKPPSMVHEPSVRGCIADDFNRRLQQHSNRKEAIFETCEAWDIKNTMLEEILKEDKMLHSLKGPDSA